MKKEDKNFNEAKQIILDDIQKEGIIMLYLHSNGDITTITSGNLTKKQIKIAERLVAAIEPSLILSIIFFIEIIFVKIQDLFVRSFR